MSSVEPNDVTYELSIPESTIDYGYLSALQLETIVYTCQTHNTRLPSGERAGFLIGEFHTCPYSCPQPYSCPRPYSCSRPYSCPRPYSFPWPYSCPQPYSCSWPYSCPRPYSCPWTYSCPCPYSCPTLNPILSQLRIDLHNCELLVFSNINNLAHGKVGKWNP